MPLPEENLSDEELEQAADDLMERELDKPWPFPMVKPNGGIDG